MEPIYEDAPDIFNPMVVMSNEECIYKKNLKPELTKNCRIAADNNSFRNSIMASIMFLMIAKGVLTIIDKQ